MSECNICIGSDDSGGTCEFYSASVVRARKPHKCHECGRTIAVASEYEKIASKFDGDFSETKSCLDCMNIRKSLSCGNGVTLGCLWEDIDEIFPHVNMACVAKIKTTSAKEYFLDRWAIWKGLKVNP